MASLWSLAGRPPLAECVPPAASLRWLSFRRTLRIALQSAQTTPPRLAGPRSLWSLLHDTPCPPRGLTWHALLQDHTINTLQHKLTLQPAAGSKGIHFATWNLRWIKAHDTEQAACKRAVILHLALAGHIISLQETHWTAQSQATWKAAFPGCNVIGSPAREGPRGGPQGGVAIIVPARYSITASRTLVEGCAIEATLQDTQTATTITAQSLYLPPSDRENTLHDFIRTAQPAAYLGADLNFPLYHPRNTAEQDLAHTFLNFLGTSPSDELNQDAITRRTPQEAAQLDILKIPTSGASTPQWLVRRRWHMRLSDHAIITASPTLNAASTGRRCTPAAIQLLPTEAIQDLRHRFASLEWTLQIRAPPPLLQQIPNHPNNYHITRPGDNPDHVHPATDEDQLSHPDNALHDIIPVNDHAAKLGRPYVSAIIRSWWNHWQRHKSDSHPVEAELTSRSPDPTAPSVPLQHWLQQHGANNPTDPLTPQERNTWLHVWRQEARARPTSGSTHGSRTLRRRQPSTTATTIGRHLMRTRTSLQVLQDQNGQLTHDPTRIQEILWNSRADIWASDPPQPAGGDHILDTYFDQHRRAEHIAHTPQPTWHMIAAPLLHAAGSAPGLDNEPYETYHHGLPVVCTILAQALYASNNTNQSITDILGPSNDLLVWIPKKSDTTTPSGCRPLQLPSCIRRAFGAIIAGIIGPAVEPHFTPHQAAIKGGSCGPNIRSAYQHLELHDSQGADGSSTQPPDLWTRILGPASAEAWAWANQHDQQPIRNTHAVLLVDQSKAFERVSWHWTQRVLSKWQLPPWSQRCLLETIMHRTTQAVTPGHQSTTHPLRRGLGMGGPASPLVWNMTYDPIVHSLATILQRQCPVFVDDLAALIVGPVELARSTLFLMCAGHAAGLHIECHTCRELQALNLHSRAIQILEPFPVQFHRETAQHEHWTRITGLPPELTYRLLATSIGDNWATHHRIVNNTCHCKAKTCVIPAHSLALWKRAAHDTPHGNNMVTTAAIYLGAMLAKPHIASPQPPQPHSWQQSALDDLRNGTWASAGQKTETRVSTTLLHRLSPGYKAHLWNTYILPLGLYPAAIAPAPTTIIQCISRQLRRMLALGTWATTHIITGSRYIWPRARIQHIGCPIVAGTATSISLWLQEQYWGPTPFRNTVHDQWQHVYRWATAEPHPANHQQHTSARTMIQQIHTATPTERRALLTKPSNRKLLKEAVWASQHSAKAHQWLRIKSFHRRWLRTNGIEWRLIEQARTYTEFFHVLRLLAGGLRGKAGQRARHQRQHQPWICHSCARPQVDIAWATPDGSPEQRATGWCRQCTPPRLLEHGFASLIQDPNPDNSALPQAHRPSSYGPCPLCGLGEGGGEHIVHWCPVVQTAWTQLTAHLHPAPARTIAHAIIEPSRADHILTAILHQASFLHLSLSPPSHPTPQDIAATANQLTRQTQWSLAHHHHPDEPTSDDEADSPPGTAEQEEPINPDDTADFRNRHRWQLRATHPCSICQNPPTQRVRGPDTYHIRQRRTAKLRTTETCTRNTTLLHLFNSAPVGTWPAPLDRWLPSPRIQQQPNAHWRAHRCEQCNMYTVELVASTDIPNGSEVTAPPCPHIVIDTPHIAEYLVTFDGHPDTPTREGGAAAILWGPLVDGYRHALDFRTATIEIGSHTTNTTAEGTACCLALDLLHTIPHPTTASIAGDNPTVLGLAAGLNRTTQPALALHILPRIGSALASGWHITWILTTRDLNTATDHLARNPLHNPLSHTLHSM